MTGVIEILLGAGLVAWHDRRRDVALALVAYLVAVFPANVYVAVAGVSADNLGGGDPWARLPFQAVYIAWVFWAVPGVSDHARSRAPRLRRLSVERSDRAMNNRLRGLT